eukprot:scaffold117988_cov37-Phaeocystis_antarctica.AAC.1
MRSLKVRTLSCRHIGLQRARVAVHGALVDGGVVLDHIDKVVGEAAGEGVEHVLGGLACRSSSEWAWRMATGAREPSLSTSVIWVDPARVALRSERPRVATRFDEGSASPVKGDN